MKPSGGGYRLKQLPIESKRGGRLDLRSGQKTNGERFEPPHYVKYELETEWRPSWISDLRSLGPRALRSVCEDREVEFARGFVVFRYMYR